MGSIRGKAHILPDNAHRKGQHSSGALEDMSRQGKKGSVYGKKMQAHIVSIVIMDIAAFKVSHSVGIDKDATTLQAIKWSA